MKNILVIVDMQNDFVDGSLANEEGDKVVKNVVREINSKKYDYILVTLDTHFDDTNFSYNYYRINFYKKIRQKEA